jgi:hypothetical protein
MEPVARIERASSAVRRRRTTFSASPAWSWLRGSNPLSPLYKSGAGPDPLSQHVAPSHGFEPRFRRSERRVLPDRRRGNTAGGSAGPAAFQRRARLAQEGPAGVEDKYRLPGDNGRLCCGGVGAVAGSRTRVFAMARRRTNRCATTAWSHRRDSNPGPLSYQDSALTGLSYDGFVVPRAGVEPALGRVWAGCLSRWATAAWTGPAVHGCLPPGSNRQLSRLQPDALPSELERRGVDRRRVELLTDCLPSSPAHRWRAAHRSGI